MKNGIVEKLEILQKLYKSDFFQPFPYEDCRKILKQNRKEFEDLIPSLDVYFSDVAGFCSSGKRIERWTEEQIAAVESKLGDSFFERFPTFTELKSEINEKQTPRLHSQLLIFDLMRLTFVDILSEIKKSERFQSAETRELSLTG